jgi:DNA primase
MQEFGLGFVAEPDTAEDEPMRGRISVPYLVNSPVHGGSCVGLKFRSLNDDKPKYLYRAGLTPAIYNPVALLQDTNIICVTEGEIDAISASQAGLPCVGIPGSTQWQDWYPRLFKGYKAIYMLQDNDEAGKKMAEKWAKAIPGVKVIVMPDGDVNGTLVARGESYLRELIGFSLPEN